MATATRRNNSLWKAESALTKSEEKAISLQYQVDDLLRIIREREENTDSNEDCNCGDWRSIGSDPSTGDKLKRCNICERIGVR